MSYKHSEMVWYFMAYLVYSYNCKSWH